MTYAASDEGSWRYTPRQVEIRDIRSQYITRDLNNLLAKAADFCPAPVLWTFDIDNLPTFVHSNLDLPRGGLPWILRLKNFAQLFQRLSSSFNKEEVDDDKLDYDPTNIDLECRKQETLVLTVETTHQV